MSLIKANQLYREKKYKDALEIYIKLRNENPNFSIYNKNIESIYKVGYRPLKYSIVSAVYGVEPYLNEFIYSVINQTLEFKENIELILVDDGSLDGSAEIIKRWKKEYPYNIKYIYKENGGQASARNTGMEYVTTDWVTFIDPDDFISKNYFKEIDNYLLGKENETSLISCNLIFYFEAKSEFSDKHPLSYRFVKNIKVLNINKLSNEIQLSVSTALFKIKVIKKYSLKMNTNIKPNFEDADFVTRYLISSFTGNIVFLKYSQYFYRKRVEKTSSLDNTWTKKEQFCDKLKYGSLRLLEFSKENNKITKYVENLVLYDLIWFFGYLINNSEKVCFLTGTEKKNFLNLIEKILSKISIDTILKFNLAGCWFLHKVGFLAFKNISPKINYVYLDDYSYSSKVLKIYLFSKDEITKERFFLNGKEIQPLVTKMQIFDFVGRVFIFKKIIYLFVSEFDHTLKIETIPYESQFSMGSRKYKNEVSIKKVINFFNTKLESEQFPIDVQYLRGLSQDKSITNIYKNAWVFMDKDIQADDNAEHFYRYVKNNYPRKNIFFILNEKKHDWKRLKKEGFKLINFNSQEHRLVLLNADYLISSHADHYIYSLLEKRYFKDLLNYKYIFLQHGVIMNDLSNWLNSKPIELFITTTKPEYSSISGTSRYKFTKKEVLLSGLPRHDNLLFLSKNIETEKVILIMPTWRHTLLGKAIGTGSKRTKDDAFYQSDYAFYWKSILHSKQLKEISDQYKYKVIFFPHSNLEIYLDFFEVPKYISVKKHSKDFSIQTLFASTAMMLTDYSSVAFEMAYLNKPIIYYQFDYDFVFGGGHSISKGYFSYENDGFGPVCYDEDNVFRSLKHLLENNAKLDKKYLARIEETFEFRDGKCSQRVYEAICKLNSRYS